MYPNVYDHQKVEISFTQILMAAVIVMVALVLPAQYFVSQQNNPTHVSVASTTTTSTANTASSSGRVAGASTTSPNLITIPILNITINLSDQSQLLYLVGGGLIIFSIILFVIATEPKKQEQKLPPHWR